LQRASQTGAHDGLRRIADLLPEIDSSPLVILVDQFEEVYSLCEDATERNILIENLVNAASDRAAHVSVILTLRSDFLGETQRHPVLNQIVAQQGVIIPAMTQEELRRAITKPAELAGHPLDEATVNLLVEETEGREGALPLLQFALTRIWEGLNQGIEPAVTLERIGGVGGALAGEAQRIFDNLSPQEQEIARRVFLGLVQLGEGTRDTRRRTAIAGLVSYKDNPERVKQVIGKFAARDVRLIALSFSPEAGDTAEVTHEALFDHWNLLNQWLDSGRNDIRFQRRLEEAAKAWEENHRPEGSLWRPPDLDLLRRYYQRAGNDMTPLQVDFFKASQQAENARKCLRQMGIGGLIAGLVVTTATTGLAVYQWQRAERQRLEQYKAAAESLVPVNPTLSLVNGISAIGLGRLAFVRFPDLSKPSLVPASLLQDAMETIREKDIFYGHEASVRAIAISPDGKTIASGSNDRTIRLWNWQGKPVGQPLRGNEGAVIDLAFSPDGKTIVSGGSDFTVRLWTWQGKQIWQTSKEEGHDATVYSVAFSPDGKYIASGSSDGTVRLWTRQGRLIWQTAKEEKHKLPVRVVTFSPDGKTIASGDYDGEIVLWDLQGQILRRLEQFETTIYALAFSPDGKLLVSGNADRRLRLWKLENKGAKPVLDFQAHGASILAIAFSPDGKTIASGGYDRTIRLWDSNGKPVGQPLRGHEATVNALTFSQDGKTLVSGSADRTVRLWDVAQKALKQPFQGHETVVYSVAFSSDGKHIASGSGDRTVRLWDLQGKQIWQTSKKQGHEALVYSVAFSPNKNSPMIVSSGYDGTIRLWDGQGKQIWQTSKKQGHGAVVFSVAFSPNGQMIASVGGDRTVRLWDLQGNLKWKTRKERGHEASVYSVAFSPDGKTIASSGADRTIRLWDLTGNPIRKPLRGHANYVRSVVFSPDGKTIASGSDDGTIRLWDLQGNPIGKPFGGHTAAVRSVAFSPDGKTIASGGEDGTVRLWDLSGNQLAIQEYKISIYALAFSPDGKWIVSGTGTGQLRVWMEGEKWLQKACERLRVHSILRAPRTDVAREAKATCDRYVWRIATKNSPFP
jgi:WD40 repeat protein